MTEQQPPNWDERYAVEEYLYGKEPNDFVRDTLPWLGKGRALCLAAGEGRNAVFLARNGFDVTAVDQSGLGLEKARALAEETGVEILTLQADLTSFEIETESWDLITSIFLHLPPPDRRRLYADAVRGLKPGGSFLLEAFTPEQIEHHTGGPKAPELLMKLSDLEEELSPLQWVHAMELVRPFKEGPTHVGLGAVVQIHGVKQEETA